MEFERMSMAHLKEIMRLLEEKRAIQEIASTFQCRKQTAIDVKKGLLSDQMLNQAHQSGQYRAPPVWVHRINWDSIKEEIHKGFEITSTFKFF